MILSQPSAEGGSFILINFKYYDYLINKPEKEKEFCDINMATKIQEVGSMGAVKILAEGDLLNVLFHRRMNPNSRKDYDTRGMANEEAIFHLYAMDQRNPPRYSDEEFIAAYAGRQNIGTDAEMIILVRKMDEQIGRYSIPSRIINFKQGRLVFGGGLEERTGLVERYDNGVLLMTIRRGSQEYQKYSDFLKGQDN